MKGRTPTKSERQWMNAICQIGCIVCRNEYGVFSPAVPHHMDGKTKEGAHLKTIPLCGAHHQTGEGCISRHPYKARFEAEYGTEEELLEQCRDIISDE